MLTLCIRYTLDATKLADFEAYARAVTGPIERCGGKVVGLLRSDEVRRAHQRGALAHRFPKSRSL